MLPSQGTESDASEVLVLENRAQCSCVTLLGLLVMWTEMELDILDVHNHSKHIEVSKLMLWWYLFLLLCLFDFFVI